MCFFVVDVKLVVTAKVYIVVVRQTTLPTTRLCALYVDIGIVRRRASKQASESCLLAHNSITY